MLHAEPKLKSKLFPLATTRELTADETCHGRSNADFDAHDRPCVHPAPPAADANTKRSSSSLKMFVCCYLATPTPFLPTAAVSTKNLCPYPSLLPTQDACNLSVFGGICPSRSRFPHRAARILACETHHSASLCQRRRHSGRPSTSTWGSLPGNLHRAAATVPGLRCVLSRRSSAASTGDLRQTILQKSMSSPPPRPNIIERIQSNIFLAPRKK